MNSSNKVVFLGDSGVGKSQLINTLIGLDNQRPHSTVGCSIQILPHQFAAGTPDECNELIEIWDIGGSNTHRKTSSVFLDQISGITLWYELLSFRRKKRSSIPNLYRLSSTTDATTMIGGFFENDGLMPTLVIGTHYDVCSNHRKEQLKHPACISFLNHYEHIYLDARRPISAGSTNRMIFSRFFDAIVQKSHLANSPYNSRRRRLV